MSCVEAPPDCRDTWQRTYAELAESDLEGPEDESDLCAGLLRKRLDALAFRLPVGSKSVMILEFMRGSSGAMTGDKSDTQTLTYTKLNCISLCETSCYAVLVADGLWRSTKRAPGSPTW